MTPKSNSTHKKPRKRKDANDVQLKHVRNADKLAHDEEPLDPRGILPMHPCRILLAGPPSCGKRSLALQIINAMEQYKVFDTVTILHLVDESQTDEYKGIFDDRDFKHVTYDSGIPAPTDFDRQARNLLICDEAAFTDMPRKMQSQLERLMNYASTHHSLSIVVMQQDLFAVPKSIRRSLTHICVFKTGVINSLRAVGAMMGIKGITDIFHRHVQLRHDCLTFDMTGVGPCLRKNFFTVIHGEI